MLLYRLIFSAIQYRGKCSDWSGPHKVPLVDFVPPDFGAGLRVEGMHE
jgi:hypothetical protein